MALATIVVKDECNIKILGLEPYTRKRLSDKFKFKLPGAYFMPATRLWNWDGMISFFQISGSSYVNLLPEIIPILEEEKYKIVLQDEREYTNSILFTDVVADEYSNLRWPEKHIMAGEPIVLRDYQVQIINTFLNDTQCIQEIATGAGKTLVTAALSQKCEIFGRTIVIVPNKSLVTQTEQDYKNLGLDVGVFYGERKEFDRTHTVCTWQSLGLLMKKTKSKETLITIDEFLEKVICVIVDECHNSKAQVLKDLLTGPFSKIPIRWGLTGTIPKEPHDQISLLCSLGHVVNKISAKELQDKNVLANCHVNILQLIDYKEFNNYQKELKYLLLDTDRQKYICSLIAEASKNGNTLVLVDRVSAGKEFVQQLKDRNIDSVFISGVTKNTTRKEHYDEIQGSTNKIIIATYGVASVGINIPRIFNLVLLEPGKSFIRVIQSIGRGLRKADDKDFVQIWDITSTCKFAKRHLTQRKKFYKDAKYDFTIEKVDWQ